MPSRYEQHHTLPGCSSPALVADMNSRLAVVVTHPWGPLGGSMHNNVVAAAVLYFQRLGITTLRFNFCGWQVGRGYRQVRQVHEAADYILSGAFRKTNKDETQLGQYAAPPPSYVLLVGYSYGSLIAASASATMSRCVGVVSIAPPLGVKHWLLCFNGNYHMNQARERRLLPKLLVLGSNDNFTSENLFNDTVQTFDSESTTGAILKDADHFFARRERDLMAIVGQWLMNTYGKDVGGDLKQLGQIELVSYTHNIGGTPTKDEQGESTQANNKAMTPPSFLNDCSVLESACRY